MSRGESPRIASARSVKGGPWWRSYQREWLSRDLLAGVTVAAYMVPQVMGHAAIAGLAPITGLWAVCCRLSCTALFLPAGPGCHCLT
jgi:sulfate permease, SulP family